MWWFLMPHWEVVQNNLGHNVWNLWTAYLALGSINRWNTGKKKSLKQNGANWHFSRILRMYHCFVSQVQSHSGVTVLPSPPALLYPNISFHLLFVFLLPPAFPSAPVLIMPLFSSPLSGGLPWTNIVPRAGSSGGPYCVWRNGKLTPMSEHPQWKHCVWIFLGLTQSHPLSPSLHLLHWLLRCYVIKNMNIVKIKLKYNLQYLALADVSHNFLCLVCFWAPHSELNVSL